MDDPNELNTQLAHLARLALAGKKSDVLLLIRRLIKKSKSANPDLAGQLSAVIKGNALGSTIVRDANAGSIPVDHDSRLELARIEDPVILDVEPVWNHHIQTVLQLVVEERIRENDLLAEDLHPTKSLLFTGPPGVGKTLAARWLAERLGMPLVVLDLSAVMSSFLGRTGNNLRHVLDFAKESRCVLLLDEFDAIAKRRDDVGEIGELKRLVTVLLQEIDDFPPTSILVAATNHSELLDPAVWRRFEIILEFPLPMKDQITEAVLEFLGHNARDVDRDVVEFSTAALSGSSFSEIERSIRLARRNSIVSGLTINDSLTRELATKAGRLSRVDKVRMVGRLERTGLSQRRISELTGISRDTLRKMDKQGAAYDGETT